MRANDLLERYPELAELLRNRSFSYPVRTKADFIEQMVASSDTVVFRGVSYDARMGAGLVPDFFFPLASEEDLLTKIVELLVSRGLVPLG